MTRRAIALALAAVLLVAAPAGAAPFPPQLPTAEEMAKLESQLAKTLGRVRAAQRELDTIVRDYEVAGDRLTHLAGAINAAQLKQDTLDSELRAAQAAINNRAANVYTLERIQLLNVIVSARSFHEFLSAVGMMRSVTTEDSKALMRIRNLKGETMKARTDLESQKVEQQRVLAELAQKQRQMEKSLAALGREYEVVRAELEKRKSGFTFPVKAPYSYVDSWGAARMEGTSYYHRHEGTDVFALRGTPVVAVVNGVIERMGTASLGGIKLWLRSPGDNWTYYYAHLSGYGPGIVNGKKVSKGEILGYVGNTGNARGTPPHLHFETHVPSGSATNPYPILVRIDPLKS